VVDAVTRFLSLQDFVFLFARRLCASHAGWLRVNSQVSEGITREFTRVGWVLARPDMATLLVPEGSTKRNQVNTLYPCQGRGLRSARTEGGPERKGGRRGFV